MKSITTFVFLKGKSLFSRLRRSSLGEGMQSNHRTRRADDVAAFTPVKQPTSIENEVDMADIRSTITELENRVEMLADSVRQDGRYDDLQSGISPLEATIRSECNKAGRKCLMEAAYIRDNAVNLRADMAEQLNAETAAQRKERFIQQNAEQMNQELVAAEKPLLNIPVLKQEQSRTQQNKERAEAKRDKVHEKDYDGMTPIKGFFQKPWVYLSVVAVVLPVEVTMVSEAIDKLSDNNFRPMEIEFIAGTIAFMMALGGHLTGVLLSRKTGKLLAVAPASVVVILLAIVCYVRFNGAESAFVLFFINVAAVILVTLLSYYRHKDDAYFKAEGEASRLARAKVSLGSRISQIEKAVEAEKQRVYDHWNAKALAFVRGETGRLKDIIADCDRKISAYDNYLENRIVGPIEGIYEGAVQGLRTNINLARRQNDLESVSFDSSPIRPLDFYNNVTKDLPSKNGSEGGRDGLYAACITLLLLVFSLAGCAPEPESLSREGIYIADWSINQEDSSALPPVADQIAFLFSSLEFEPYSDTMAVTKDALKITVTHIDRTSFPPLYTVELKEGETYRRMIKSHRRTAQKEFIKRVEHEITAQFKPQGLPYSYVQACLCESLAPLARSQADVKQVLIVSDMILYNPDMGVNFYRYGNTLMDNYETVAQKLDIACPAMSEANLGGIEITAVYLPKVEDDVVATQTRRFWEKYLSEKGAKIEFKANLPKSFLAIDE